MNKHFSVFHEGERNYQCPLCEKKFGWPGHLKVHKEEQHSDARPFPCNICKQTFKRKHSLKKHNIVHIQRTATIVCKTCLMTTVGGPSLVNSVAKNSQQSRVLKFMLGFMVGKNHIIVKYVRNHLTRLGTWEVTWKKYMDQKLRWLIAHWYIIDTIVCVMRSFGEQDFVWG